MDAEKLFIVVSAVMIFLVKYGARLVLNLI